MDLEAQAMSGAVNKPASQPCLFKNTPGGRVDLSLGSTWQKCSFRRLLRFPDRAIPAAQPCGSTTQKDGTCQVAAIVVEYSTQVEDDQFIFPEYFGTGPGVRQSRSAARSNNGVKRRAARALPPHSVLDLSDQLKLTNTRSNEGQDLFKGRQSKLSRLAHSSDFVTALDLAQLFDKPEHPSESNARARGFSEFSELGHCKQGWLISKPTYTAPPEVQAHPREQRTAYDLHTSFLHLLSALDQKSPVGEEAGRSPLDQERS